MELCNIVYNIKTGPEIVSIETLSKQTSSGS